MGVGVGVRVGRVLRRKFDVLEIMRGRAGEMYLLSWLVWLVEEGG